MASLETPRSEFDPLKDRNPYVRIYQGVLDQNGFSRDDSWLGIQADSSIVKTTIDGVMPSLPVAGAHKNIALSEGFGTSEVQAGVRETIALLHGSGVIKPELVVSAAKYARPKTTVYVEDAYDHQIHEGRMDVGGEGIRSKAHYIAGSFERAGVALSSPQILNLALIEGLGHEYGHALHRAFLPPELAKDVRVVPTPTLDKAKALGFARNSELIENNLPQIHDEHIAQGFSNVAVEEYLRKIGLPEDQAKRFMDSFHRNYPQGEQAFDFIKNAIAKGFSIEDVSHFSTALLTVAYDIFPEDFFLFRIDEMISYHSQPYTRDQLRELFS